MGSVLPTTHTFISYKHWLISPDSILVLISLSVSLLFHLGSAQSKPKCTRFSLGPHPHLPLFTLPNGGSVSLSVWLSTPLIPTPLIPPDLPLGFARECLSALCVFRCQRFLENTETLVCVSGCVWEIEGVRQKWDSVYVILWWEPQLLLFSY